MPAADESDEWTDEDPWGSDFETDDDETRSRVIEEEPYDSVEVLPLSQRRRPVSILYCHREIFYDVSVLLRG